MRCGLKFPERAALLEIVPLEESNPSPKAKPDYLVSLGEAQWPEWVVDKLVNLFGEAGLENPLLQKYVEPSADAFRGIGRDVTRSEINWQLAIDFFIWEIEAVLNDNEEGGKQCQRAMYKKYGTKVAHYEVYGRPGMY